MKKKNLLVLTLLPFLLAGCSKSSNDSSSEGSKEESSDYSSGEDTGLPDAPVDEMNLSLANFTRLEVLPTPTITGLVAENIEIAYSYHNHETGARIGDYVAGAAAGSIELGQYKLKAAVTSSTYKPFELSADFSVVKATFPEFEMVAYDYDYDEVKPEPDFFYTSDSSKVQFPVGTVITYKYYHLSSDKHDYVPGTPNDIDSGSYHLEATISHPDYEEVVMNYDFVVMKINPSASSTGSRIVIGNYVGQAHDTVPHIDRSFFTGPLAIHYDLRDQINYAWSMFSLATFTIESSDSSIAHIDGDGKLVVDDLSAEDFTILVGSSDPNYYVNATFDVYLVDAPATNRELALTYDDTFATCNGLDKTIVESVSEGTIGKGDGSVVKLKTNGAGFRIDSKFKAIKSVSIKYRLDYLYSASSFTMMVSASTSTSYVPSGDDVSLTRSVTVDGYDEGTFVDYDFSGEEFDAEKSYYLLFWLDTIPGASGEVNVREIKITYDAANFIPANA